jgi:F0F1-type ATP synthase membrane subunit b/b'
MDQNLAVTFTNGQLAILVVVLGIMLWAVGAWTVNRTVASVERAISKLEAKVDQIPQNHPTRVEVNAEIRARIAEARVGQWRRHDGSTLPGVYAPESNGE